jgi:carbamoyl-phosphate synthase small subunit
MRRGLNMDYKPALLALEDGSLYSCRSFTGHGQAEGEIVFNTGMTGYQEILTDPSYSGQMVVMTYPLIGNYGVSDQDMESGRIQPQAILVREYTGHPSNFRASSSLAEFLAPQGIMGVCELDTRAVTLRIREAGAMRAKLSTLETNGRILVEQARSLPSMTGLNLSAAASTEQPYRWANGETAEARMPPLNIDVWQFRGVKPSVAVLDFGVKHNILRMLEHTGFEVIILPVSTDADAILSLCPDGLLLSNGPGDPEPVVEAILTIRALLGSIPMFGICLGHQLLALALGAKTYKMKFGHRGSNQPVLDVRTGRVEITSQNHGFAVDEESLRRTGAEITHINLNDRTIEGFRHDRYPILSVQYHPEAAPGPRDAAHLFSEFYKLLK